MAVKTRFVCEEVQHRLVVKGAEPLAKIRLVPTDAGDGKRESTANSIFGSAAPTATIEMVLRNAQAIEQFKAGMEYDVVFSEAVNM